MALLIWSLQIVKESSKMAKSSSEPLELLSRMRVEWGLRGTHTDGSFVGIDPYLPPFPRQHTQPEWSPSYPLSHSLSLFVYGFPMLGLLRKERGCCQLQRRGHEKGFLLKVECFITSVCNLQLNLDYFKRFCEPFTDLQKPEVLLFQVFMNEKCLHHARPNGGLPVLQRGPCIQPQLTIIDY